VATVGEIRVSAFVTAAEIQLTAKANATPESAFSCLAAFFSAFLRFDDSRAENCQLKQPQAAISA
jgi:hypothetical protein